MRGGREGVAWRHGCPRRAQGAGQRSALFLPPSLRCFYEPCTHPSPSPHASHPPAASADDEQFKEEKAVIIKEISLLQPPPLQPVA